MFAPLTSYLQGSSMQAVTDDNSVKRGILHCVTSENRLTFDPTTTCRPRRLCARPSPPSPSLSLPARRSPVS